MQHYEGAAFGDLNAGLDGLEIRFKDSNDATRMIEELRETHEERHDIYDELVDTQQDEDEKLDLWEDADERRDEYDALLDEAKKLRSDLIAVLENSILGA